MLLIEVPEGIPKAQSKNSLRSHPEPRRHCALIEAVDALGTRDLGKTVDKPLIVQTCL